MHKECENLKNIKSKVQERAEVAQRNLQRISHNGEAWLTSVDTTTEHVETIRGSLDFFKQKVGIFVNNPSLLDITKEVDKECKGLPLVIIIVAGALKNLKTKPSWDCDLEQLRSDKTRINPEVTKELYKPLSLSYDFLECNEAKNLFLYGRGLCIFSEIGKLEQARSTVCLLLETLNDYFFLAQCSDKNYVKMHDVVRDVAISIPSEGEHNFMDDFFDGMDKLNVFSLSVYREYPVLPLPVSIRRLSSLRTLCLSNLVCGDISIIGNLVTLEILSIRDSRLVEVLVEIGKLTNLIMLELRNECKTIERISTGVLSSLVQSEELHMVVVEYCSYSTLSELKFSSRLTALTLSKCAKDVIYSNLSLSSKLIRYNLTVSDMWTSIMDDYDRNITLEVMETRPLGNWICHLLKESEFIHSIVKGSNNVLTELQQNKLQNVKCLRLARCNLVTHLLTSSRRRHEIIKFFNLYELKLQYLKCLTHFCSDNVEAIKFPQLRKMIFDELLKFQNFWPTANDSITISNPLFHEKVSCLNLKELDIYSSNISSLCSHQLPIAYFSKLETLEVKNCRKLRNLISPSVTRGARNLRILLIENCVSMEKVITQEEQRGEDIMNNEPLFLLLEELQLERLPKLKKEGILKKQHKPKVVAYIILSSPFDILLIKP
uniref:Disease resistance protein At4g27190-like leucine-rich repeats domain-containing protein n=1 Tax=Solanum lycopersicum TaxID=4081 RepID=A0A3Q7IIB6_SOLLC